LSGLPSIAGASRERESETMPLIRMVVTFIGLYGPQGVLPQHYTQLVIDRVRKKDTALRDFLDAFNHRIISLFYRAWEKYHFAVGYDRTLRSPELGEDLFTRCLFSLVGLAPPTTRNRLALADRTLLYYASHFSHRPRNVWALTAMLNDYFRVPVTVQQFQGQWLYLNRENQSRMLSDPDAEMLNNQLGMDVIVGDRVWSIENKFRVRLGPLSYRQFRRFTPFGDRLEWLGQFVRMYVGPEWDFDVQPVLRAAEIPACRLGGEGGDPAYLGWNTWLISEPRETDADEPTFVSDGRPTAAA
jgi:type VI secretion system protein ImpH